MTEDQQHNDPQFSDLADSRKAVGNYEYSLVAVGAMLPLIGPLLFCWIIFDSLIRRRLGSGRLFWVSFVGMAFGVYFTMALLGGYVDAKLKSKESQTKTNVHDIQIALERYWVDHCVYPADIATLQSEGYIGALPMNPFTRQPMREISFGASPYQGEFTYVRFMIDNNVRGFDLLTYGKNGGNGQDIDEDGIDDHVILVVESGCDCDCTGPHDLREAAFPSLPELLKTQKENLPIEIDDGQKSAERNR
jgi:hypothetical protein